MVHIDASKTFQTIVGFGVTIPSHAADQSKVYSQAFFDMLVNDLGCSIIRTEFLTQATETPDQTLLDIQLNDFNYLKSIKLDLKVLASISSPPGTMIDSGKLKSSSRESFGKYLFDMCDDFEQHNCPIYGLGFQNNPVTNSLCNYDSESYYQMFKIMSEIKSKCNSQVKLLATEDESCTALRIREFLDKIDSDSAVKNSLEFLGVRGHIDTSWGNLMTIRVSNPTATLKDLYAYVYSKFKTEISSFGKDFWLIENNFEDPSWKTNIDYNRTVTHRDPEYYSMLPMASMDLALKIHSALTSGNFSAYVYWLASTLLPVSLPVRDSRETLCDKGLKTLKYQVAKHFYKYILPGMVRIDAVSEDVGVSAFISDKVVAVLINDRNVIVESSIELVGANVSAFTSYASVQNEFHHQESGSIVNNKIDITMLPNSIITFVME